ncbi:MAG TPA: AAA family ATPase [Chondromyces sp.]|nr:AAA family ATPase [Chondromyces sp.]
MAKKQQAQEKKRGQMIAVCSARGGSGRTTLTVNLAVALSKKNIPVSILDGDFQFGDVSLAMDLQPAYTIKDVVEQISRIDEHLLNNYLTVHESGVKVLPAPERPEHAELIKSESLLKIIDLMLQQSEYLVVDTGVGFQEQTIELLEKANQILVVTNLDMVALRNTKTLLQTLTVIGLRDRVQIVVNRSTMESVLQASQIPEMLDDEHLIYIPNNFQMASRALNLGIPFVTSHGRSEMARSILKLAEQIISGNQPAVNKIEKRKWFNRKYRGGDIK